MDKVKKKSKRIESFSVVYPHAAGIDVGSTEMVVAVGSEVCDKNIRTFGCFTDDYCEIARWLKSCHITHVAMESTGVYWIQLYLHLEAEGFQVALANAKHVKNVSGRKDDEIDALWIQRLYSCGLIRNSFQPNLPIRGLRDLVRHRKTLVRDQSRCTNRMLKALESMNIKVQTVISDIDGKTGKKIIEAIVKGERDPEVLSLLADKRIKASRQTLIRSLEGNWNTQQLFLLEQQHNMHNFLSKQVADCDLKIEEQLQKIITSDYQKLCVNLEHPRKRSTGKNAVTFNVTAYLQAMLKTDITQIPGISEITALEFISEIGTNIERWPTSKHFTAWLGIVPNTKISGGKIISSKLLKKKNRAAQALRMAASCLYNSKTPLGDYYRRKQSKGGPAKAIIATAAKIAIMIYEMIKQRSPYQPNKMIDNQKKYKYILINRLEERIKQLKKAA